MSSTSFMALLESHVTGIDTDDNATVGDQRMVNHTQYAGEPYGDERDGHSKHISMDVWDAVESAKAVFQEVFAGARKVLRFNAEGEGDALAAGFATDYVHRQMFTENKGFRILRDSVHDAQVAKRCVWRVTWNEELVRVPLPQQPNSREELIAIVQAAQQQGVKLELDQESGQLLQVVDTSASEIILVQPERFYRESTTYIDDAQYCGEWGEYARGQLIRMGFDEDEVTELKVESTFRKSHEDNARRQQSGQISTYLRPALNKNQQRVTLYTTYMWVDLSDFADEFMRGEPSEGEAGATPPKGYRLYKFLWSCGELLTNPTTGQKWEEAEEFPYFEWTPYKISHAEHGMSDADIVGHIQRSKTSLMRLMIDNQARVNAGGVIARRNALMNPRELLENNIGGVLWVKSGQLGEAVMDRPQPQLSAATFAVLEMLDTQKEERTGNSRLAKGLNADAVSNQNADRMIERLTNASNRRVLRMVRDFAEELLGPVYMHLYELGRRHDKRTYGVEVAGRWAQYSPQQFKQRQTTAVDHALGSGESAMRIAVLLQVYAMVMQDQGLGLVFGAKQRHGVLDEVFELLGYKDSSPFVLSPESDAFVTAQQQMQQQAMQQAQQQNALQLEQFKLLWDEQKRKWQDTRISQGRLLLDATDKAADNRLQRSALDEKRVHNAATVDIERMKVVQQSNGGAS